MQTSDYTDLGTYVRHNATRVLIPKDPANRDYAAYLAWLEAGGVAEHEESPLGAVSGMTAEPPPSVTDGEVSP